MKRALYIGFVLGTCLLTGCSAHEKTQTNIKEESKVLADEQTKEDAPLADTKLDDDRASVPLQLTQEQKEDYHKQYEEIVKRANETKIGIKLGVASIAEFENGDWVEPHDYEQRIQEHIDSFLASEREALSKLSSTTTEAIIGSNGEMKKTAHLYVSDKIFLVEVSVEFDTQYQAYRKGQVFSKVDHITSQIGSTTSSGEWKQTFSEAKLVDNGRTYSLLIEGVYTLNNIATQKAFTIEFSSDSLGNIL